MNIYLEIEKYIDNILLDQFNITKQEILKYNQNPDKNQTFFVRKVWSGGTLYQQGNINFQQINILNLEIFQKKKSLNSKIENLVHKLREILISKIINDSNSNSRAKIYRISITPNMNQNNWTAYTLSISIRIKWEIK